MKLTDASTVAIIGAGLSGLACAQALRMAGVSVVVLEKSRGVGGRLATRRTQDGLTFDHGAQYFTANAPDFMTFVAAHEAAGRIAPWRVSTSPGSGTASWMVGTPSINAPLKAVADTLDIRLNTEITGISRVGSRWHLAGVPASCQAIFDAVVITAPAPQAKSLAREACPPLAEAIGQAELAPCWALMFAFPSSGSAQFEVWQARDEPVSWICRNSSKPGRDGPAETWVVHASDQWSQSQLELSPQEVLDALRPLVLERLGQEAGRACYEAAHRWRYARVIRPIGEACLQDTTGTLLAAGDWCLGPRVEYAYQSGLAAARALLG